MGSAFDGFASAFVLPFGQSLFGERDRAGQLDRVAVELSVNGQTVAHLPAILREIRQDTPELDPRGGIDSLQTLYSTETRLCDLIEAHPTGPRAPRVGMVATVQRSNDQQSGASPEKWVLRRIVSRTDSVTQVELSKPSQHEGPRTRVGS